jgi:hypothetical protein
MKQIDLFYESELNKHDPANSVLGAVGGSYYWHCRFTFKDDKLECYSTERNNCKTFKELRRWWRIKKPNLKLLGAVRK